MYASTGGIPPTEPLIMRLLVRSWDYRHPRFWAGVRVACGSWNLLLGILLLAFVHYLGSLAWLALIPLAGSALLFWTAYRLQRSIQS